MADVSHGFLESTVGDMPRSSFFALANPIPSWIEGRPDIKRGDCPAYAVPWLVGHMDQIE
jgi:hypothetical protein